MARKPAPKAERRAMPEGPEWPTDEDWKRDILALMEKKGVRKADVARYCDVKPSAITAMFKPEAKQSRLVPLIHKMLGLMPPNRVPAIELDDRLRRMLGQWERMAESDRDFVLEFMDRMKPH